MTMNALNASNFDQMCAGLRSTFLTLRPLMTGEWQSQDISDKPMLATRELLNASFSYKMPNSRERLIAEVRPNLPWAEDHFRERVGGVPLNPPPSEAWWPYAQLGNADAKKDGGGEKFSHTYPERMWPKYAGRPWAELDDPPTHGIRYEYGDLQDVVNQLIRGPLTRQAYLPIWFPEDTGAVSGQRVPCTIGYHFLIRNNQLHITYYIRSCDFIRHFRDDVYMAIRLAQWVAEQVQVGLGDLTMHIVSFHIFEGDVPMLETQVREDKRKASERLAGLL